MTKFARFDHTAAEPAAVLGWYDTDQFDYGSNLPDAQDLLVLTDDQWATRMSGLFFVSGGQLVGQDPEAAAAEALAVQTVQIRAQRDGLLAASDWTQMPDSPLDDQTRSAWQTYRQALRNVPEQSSFPGSVAWPVYVAPGAAGATGATAATQGATGS